MYVSPTTAVPHSYNGPAKLAADNDGDGRKGAAALNDGDAAARIANRALAQNAAPAQSSDVTQSAHANGDAPAPQKSLDVTA